MILRALALVTALFSVPATAPADSPTRAKLPAPKGYVCYRADTPIVIDGHLDDAAWKNAPWTDEFIDIEGDVRPKPRYRTRAKMLWDDRYFYVAAEMEEPHVWGAITKHDEVIFRDNDFEVFIDPDGDNHEYYEIEINAQNAEWDLFLKRPYRDRGSALNQWEIPGLKTATHVQGTLNNPADVDHGWTVEMAFPWAVLSEYAHKPAPPRDGDQWRINFSRVEWRREIVNGKYRKVAGLKEDNWVWSPQGVIDMHRPERWGYVQFSTAAPGQTVFRPDPTLGARDALHRIYYAQAAYHKSNGRWAKSLAELGLAAEEFEGIGHQPTLRATTEGYEAAIEVGIKRLTIRQDSRIEERK
jgi:hypothetical protein